MNDKVIAVIPARYASTRLPGKPLVEIAGKSLIRWVWEAAQGCSTLDEIVVATDDDRVLNECLHFGARAVMTSPDCPSGSDRIAEAVAGCQHGIIVNIQGDEPLLDPLTVDACVAALQNDAAAGVVSAMTYFRDGEDYTEPHMVKVVTDHQGYAMYFSRAPIPDMTRLSPDEQQAADAPLKHVGLYVYRRPALEAFVRLPPSKYELAEKLEQLRLLEAGIKIRMVLTDSSAVGVDTPEDVIRVEKRLLEKKAAETS